MGSSIFGIFDMISSLVNTGVNADVAMRNLDYQKEWNEYQKKVDQRNFEFQKEQYEYQKNLQNTLFQREDNAFQRKVADLSAANLNSQLALGGGSGAGAVVATAAPQMTNNTQPLRNDFKSELDFGKLNPTALIELRERLASSRASRENVEADTENKKQSNKHNEIMNAIAEQEAQLDLINKGKYDANERAALIEKTQHQIDLLRQQIASEAQNRILKQQEISLYDINREAAQLKNAYQHKQLKEIDVGIRLKELEEQFRKGVLSWQKFNQYLNAFEKISSGIARLVAACRMRNSASVAEAAHLIKPSFTGSLHLSDAPNFGFKP